MKIQKPAPFRQNFREPLYDLKRQASPGVDGVTWSVYEEDLERRLHDLHERVHRGTYRAQPSKRTYIPMPDGRKRPLGIAALADKVVQHAVATVLNAIYEVDFLGFSYVSGLGALPMTGWTTRMSASPKGK